MGETGDEGLDERMMTDGKRLTHAFTLSSTPQRPPGPPHPAPPQATLPHLPKPTSCFRNTVILEPARCVPPRSSSPMCSPGETTWGLIWGCSVGALGVFWACSGRVPGVFWECSGTVLGVFWGNPPRIPPEQPQNTPRTPPEHPPEHPQNTPRTLPPQLPS